MLWLMLTFAVWRNHAFCTSTGGEEAHATPVQVSRCEWFLRHAYLLASHAGLPVSWGSAAHALRRSYAGDDESGRRETDRREQGAQEAYRLGSRLSGRVSGLLLTRSKNGYENTRTIISTWPCRQRDCNSAHIAEETTSSYLGVYARVFDRFYISILN